MSQLLSLQQTPLSWTVVHLKVQEVFLVNRVVRILNRDRFFTSIAVGFTSRVGAKLKGKIWANEYVDFGSLLSSFPRNEGKYSL